MATRGLSYRSMQLSEKENSAQPLKEVTKMAQGPTVRRGVLQNIGNKNVVRSTTFTGKDMVKKSFKAPLLKKQVLKKNPVVVKKSEPVQEVSMSSICAAPEDMSVVDVRPDDAESRVHRQEEENVELQPSPEKEEDQEIADLSNAFSNQMLPVTDIDAEDADNPQLVSCYVNDIYEYMRILEEKHKIKVGYLDGHSVTPRMRSILIDWLCQVHNRFNLMSETLYLTVAIVDRFLEAHPNTVKDKLQLVGVAAMFMAGKYEEMFCSEISDFVYVTDKAYTKYQIRAMEIKIFKTLKFYISYPLPLHFLRRNSKAGRVDGRQHMLAKYLMELCMVDYRLCHYRASQMGAASLFLTIRLLNPELGWNSTLAHYSAYTEDEIFPVVVKLAQCVKRSHTSKYQCVQTKYANSKYMKMSTIPELKGDVIRKLAETVLP